MWKITKVRTRVGIYDRRSRSTTHQPQETPAVKDALKEAEPRAARHGPLEGYVQERGWTVHRHYLDEGWSGTGLDRPGLQSLLEDVEAGLVDIVLVQSMSRLSRSPDVFDEVMRRLRHHGVEVVSTEDLFDLQGCFSLKPKALRTLSLAFRKAEEAALM